MTTPTVRKPGRGKPATEADHAAVALMEQRVCDLRIAGRSWARIEAELGITNADRVFKRAVTQRPQASRDEAYRVESARNDALHEKAWEVLTGEGLDSLADRVAAILLDAEVGMEWDHVPERVRAVIERAYADTLRAIPVLLKVGERRDKLDGLTHADRVADARLDLDRTVVEGMALALAESLGLLEHVSIEDRRTVVAGFAERMKALESGEA